MSLENVDGFYPLSPLQEGLLFHSVAAPRSGMYFNQCIFTLQGALDEPAFRKAWQRAIDRHEVLRTFFLWEGLKAPVQVVDRGVEAPLSVHDWRGLTDPDQRSRLDALLQSSRERGFELSRAPLMQLDLVRTADDSHEVVWSFHHLLLDGWSTFLVLGDVFKAYAAFRRGGDPEVGRARPYRDYIAWLKKQDIRSAETYWREALAGFGKPTPLAVDRPAAPGPTQVGDADSEEIRLSRETSRALEALARRERVTLNTLFQLAWSLLLSRYSGEQDVVHGTVVSGRPPELADFDSMVGLFINTLPVRARLAPDATVRSALQKVQQQLAEIRQYEFSPLAEIQGWSDAPPGRPLFESILLFENYRKEAPLESMGGDLAIRDVRWFERANYPLTMLVIPDDRVLLRVLYHRHRFDASTARRLLGHYERLLEGLVSDPGAGVWSLPLLTEPERARVVEEWSGHRTPYPRESTIQEQFEREVARAPGAEAVVCGRVRWSYGELNERANRLAHRLKELGVGAESRVGLCVARSPELVVGLLGILKAGGAYVPLDPEYPAERLAYMATDAGLEVLLTTEGERDRLPALAGVRVVSLDGEWESIAESGSGENPACETGPESLAYVMYTSGSTGKPKGTLVEQRGVVRLVKGTDYVELGPEETLLQFSTISFDASTFEIWGALLNGGRLVVYPDRRPTLEGLAEVIQGEGVTTLWLTAGLFHEMVERHLEGLRGVRQLLAGGDVLSVEHVKRAVAELDGCRVINGYGPTENTTFTCCHAVTDAVGLEGSVPIGRPIANTEVYLLDRRLEPVPVGVPGRLYTGGDGLARAYLNDAELTAARFVAHPFRAGERLYDTGDRARWRPDGTIEFLGRDDQQVKIRGYRVEPGEVETAVAEHPRVRQVVVAARGEGAGEKRLVAYVVPSAGDPLTIGELREQVRGKLPDYMIPQALVCLEALPLTANGKVDRAALPEPEAGRGALETEYAAPRTELERTIAEIWQEVLEIERVGLHDNFFDLGGNSLRVMQVYSGMRARSHDLSIVDLFTHPTVGRLARHLSGETSGGDRVGATQERAARRKRALHARQQLARQAAEGQPE